MDSVSRIFVAGHNGMVGGAITRGLRRHGYDNLILCSRAQLDLTVQSDVNAFFKKLKPEIVILCAARVGGILANMTLPASFIAENMLIQTNTIIAAQQSGVQKFIFMGSSCIYPKGSQLPINESALLSGPLEETNRPYAIAKIAGIELCWSMNRQFGTKYFCLMPTNLYGLGDTYNTEMSHVLPAMICKMTSAKREGAKSVTLWGSGWARREFLYSEDLAEACVFLLRELDGRLGEYFSSEQPPLINVGVGKEISIRDLAAQVAQIVDFQGEILWDETKPDGVASKLLSSQRLEQLGWKAKTELKDGIKLAYQDYCNFDNN
ncbi:MAG: GDP-fucose synthetase [Acidiferrobacteraceae bacterium]|nr:GDP-fucose synthetase [Acidiferrobacteraceae bacterium]